MSTATPPQSLKERQRAQREQLILDAAEELLLAQSYHEMSIDDIAARVGISKGTIYLHFASKEDLVIALMERDLREFLRTLDTILASPVSPREKLRLMIAQAGGNIAVQRFQLLSSTLESPELMGRLVARHAMLHALWEEPMRRIFDLLEAGKAAGEFDAELPTPVMLSIFISLLTPQRYHRLVTMEKMSLDDVVDYLSRFFLKGIAAVAASAEAQNGDG